MIKKEKISDRKKLKNINKEFFYLKDIFECFMDENDCDFIKLKNINKKLWDILEKQREKECLGELNDEFIKMSIAIYKLNDRRTKIKNKISTKTGSIFLEEKSY